MLSKDLVLDEREQKIIKKTMKHELGSRQCEMCDNEDIYEEFDAIGDWGEVYYHCNVCGWEVSYEGIDFWQSNPYPWTDSENGYDDGWRIELTLYEKEQDNTLWVRKEELKCNDSGYEDYFPTTAGKWRAIKDHKGIYSE